MSHFDIGAQAVFSGGMTATARSRTARPVHAATSLERRGRSVVEPSSSPHQFSEARRILEMSMIPLVCEWSDEQDMAELLRMCDRGDVLAERRTGFPLSLPAEFDTRVAIATHDAGLGIAARYLHGSMLMAARAAGFDAGRVGVASNDHRQFVSAVRDRNPAAAESIMSRHLNRSEGR